MSPDDAFTDVIVKPAPLNSSVKDTEVLAEDDQIFLTKMQSQLNQSIPSSTNNLTPSFRPSPAGVKVANDRRQPTSSPTPSQVIRSSPHLTANPLSTCRPQLDLSKGSPGGEGVLQNFFNSLLNRKSVGGVATGSPRTPNDVNNKSRVDVAAELDRMASGGKQAAVMDPPGDEL